MESKGYSIIYKLLGLEMQSKINKWACDDNVPQSIYINTYFENPNPPNTNLIVTFFLPLHLRFLTPTSVSLRSLRSPATCSSADGQKQEMAWSLGDLPPSIFGSIPPCSKIPHCSHFLRRFLHLR